MVLNHRSLRLLHNTFLASPALYTPLYLLCNQCEYPQKSWRRWMHALAPSAPQAAPQSVLSSSTSMENKHKPLSAQLPASQYVLAGMMHQCRFMAIRRKRRGAATPPKAPIQKLTRPVDEQINAATVRLVEGDSHTIIPKEDAISRARQQGLNLVQLDSQEAQPVCRILDYNQLQQEHKDVAEKKASKALEAEVLSSKMKAIRVGWNIAPHDFAVKQRKLQEFLDKGKTVSVAVTYDHRPKTWQEQYPKAVEVSKQLWEAFRATEVHSWFDYGESGNKQVTIVYSLSPPTASGKKTLLPWEPGSLLPPFLIQMQKDAEEAAKNPLPAHVSGHKRERVAR